MKNTILPFIMLQIFAIAFMFFKGYEPIFYGKEYKFEVSGVDPRDLFLGNFVIFNYPVDENFYKEINEQVSQSDKFNQQQTAYITIKRLENGLYKFDKIGFEKPKTEFIKVKYNKFGLSSVIEKIYLDKDLALKFEEELRHKNGIVSLMIMEDGKARVKNLEID